MKDLISVIIPIYNKEKYLDNCLKSIINQSYKEIEIILINDGSTDSSEEICKRYKSKDNRIKLISTENRGAASARNTGIENAVGKYFSFIDADDYIENTFYETMLDLIKTHNAQIAECGFERITEGEKYTFPKKNQETRVMTRKEALIELYGKDDKEHVKTVIMCNKLFESNLFKNIRYISGRIIDDETIIYRLIEQCKRIVETNDILYGYVQSSNSIMRKDFSMKRLDDSITVYDECIEHFKYEPDIQACCLKRAIYFYGEFLEKISKSSNIDKKEATKKVIDKFNQKLLQLENLQTEIKEKIKFKEVVDFYNEKEKKYKL